MRKILFSLVLFTGIYLVVMPSVKTQASNSNVVKTQGRMFGLENLLNDTEGAKRSEDNLRLKMVTRIVAGAVLIVGILSTIAVQFKVLSIGLGTVSEHPETLGGLIILMLLPESIVLLSFVISTLLLLL